MRRPSAMPRPGRRPVARRRAFWRWAWTAWSATGVPFSKCRRRSWKTKSSSSSPPRGSSSESLRDRARRGNRRGLPPSHERRIFDRPQGFSPETDAAALLSVADSSRWTPPLRSDPAGLYRAGVSDHGCGRRLRRASKASLRSPRPWSRVQPRTGIFLHSCGERGVQARSPRPGGRLAPAVRAQPAPSFLGDLEDLVKHDASLVTASFAR